MLKCLFVAIAFFVFCSAASAQDYALVAQKAAECHDQLIATGMLEKYFHTLPWECRDPVAKTFSAALAADLDFRGSDTPGQNMGADNPACKPLKEVGITCNYNVRYMLVDFLAVYGKVLFPRPADDSGWPNNYYIGEGYQNTKLLQAIRRNIALFKDGDLTAEEVANNWQ
jgi:hypothetical protein